MNRSFQEKSLWVQGLSLLAVYGLYFGLVMPGPPFPNAGTPGARRAFCGHGGAAGHRSDRGP
ncbi:hypothetical protein HC891_20645 [Candidatus Gracilibacteria bacterium]|nr:hypothetical protein [Candidatus Gracilibacteria bacterium]